MYDIGYNNKAYTEFYRDLEEIKFALRRIRRIWTMTFRTTTFGGMGQPIYTMGSTRTTVGMRVVRRGICQWRMRQQQPPPVVQGPTQEDLGPPVQ